MDGPLVLGSIALVLGLGLRYWINRGKGIGLMGVYHFFCAKPYRLGQNHIPAIGYTACVGMQLYYQSTGVKANDGVAVF